MQEYEDGLRDNPYQSMFADRLQGGLHMGWQRRDHARSGIQPVDVCGNIAVVGTTGSGKTSYVETILAALDAAYPVQQCFFDPKKDWQARAARHGCIIVDHDLPLNLLVPPSFMTREQYHALFVRKFCDAYYGAYHMHRILADGINEGFTQRPKGPSFAHLGRVVEQLKTARPTYQFADNLLNTGTRITDLCTMFGGIAQAEPPACLTIEDLCTRPVYFPSTGMLNAFEFVFALWVSIRHAYHLHHGIANQLHTIICTDEGLQLWQADARHITNEPLLNHEIG